MRGGIVAGIGPDGKEVPIGATAAGALEVSTGDDTGESVLEQILLALVALTDEQRATRLAVQELVNAGSDEPTDFLEMAISLREDE